MKIIKQSIITKQCHIILSSELLLFRIVSGKLPLKLVYKLDWRVAIVKSGIKVVAISQMFNI